MQFGRKSEKLDQQIKQLELHLERLQADDAEAEHEMPVVDPAPRQWISRKPIRSFCRATRRLPARPAMPARLEVAPYAHWAKTTLSGLSSCRQAYA
jgi:hypothetical protein